DFIGKAEVFQVINALLGLAVVADDRAAFEGVEDLGGVKAEHRQITVIQHAGAIVLNTECVGSVIDDLQAVGVGDFLNGIDL
nr:hypothetical protein [Tanacetum cinerariifolium]